MKARRQLPAIPGKSVDFDTMIQWLALLNDEMWTSVIVRVYRHADPVIDLQLINKDAVKYIDVLVGPFDKQYMIETHGGGKFGFFVNGEGGKELFEAKLTIPVGQYEPKIDIRTLDLKAKDNAKWITYYRSKGLLDANNNVIDQNKKPEPTSEAGSIANAVLAGFDKATQIMNRNDNRRPNEEGGLGKAIGDILVEKMRQDDPTKAFDGLAKIAGMLKQGDNSQVFTMMMTMFQSMQTTMMESQRENTKIMFESLKEIKNSGKNDKEEKSSIEQLKELVEVTELLGLKKGGSRSGWDVGMDIAKELAVPTMNLVNNILQASMLKKGAANIPMQPPIMPPNPIPNAVPNNNVVEMPKAEIGYAGMGKNTNVDLETGEVPSPTIAEVQAILMQFGNLIQKKINDKIPGYAYAESLVGMFGADRHQILAKYGVDGIIAGMKSVPEFWQPLVSVWGEEYLVNWVGEFINYEAVIARLEDEEDNEDDEGEEK